jgi:PAS domain S-box-containing protein
VRVLVVDDDEAGRYLVSAILRNSGHEVIEAVDGVDALAKVAGQPVDIAVSDILMPNMDGYALCRAWKSDPVLSKAPFVFYTATYTEPADERFAEGLGADGFFTKPQEPEVLLHLIADAVHGYESADAEPRMAEERSEEEVLREYNQRLIAKLEHKLLELNDSNAELKRAVEMLSDEVDVKRSLIEKLTIDISEKEDGQRNLVAAKELLQAIFDDAPVCIMTLDAGFIVTSWNAASEELFGWSAAEAVGSFYPPVSEDQRGSLFDAYGPVLRGEVAMREREVTRLRKDGQKVDIWTRVVPLHDARGNVTGLIVFIQDVSEMRHIEMVKSGFVSMISHELRTPLTAIIGYADLLDRVDPSEKPELYAQIMGKIRDRGDRMRRLIDNLLTLSQIQSGPVRLDLERLEVAAFLEGEATTAEVTGPHGLVVDVQEGIPPVFIDAQRMGSVMQHLLSNAVKYSPDGGDVTLRARRDDGFARISVEDHGIGIAPADLEHIFDSFTQADMSDTRSFGGVGVGLFLARQLVQAHAGRLEVTSVPGEGSTFTIVLPVIG